MSQVDEDDGAFDDEEPHDDLETCPECGVNIFCDEHDWDCSYADDDDEDD